MYRKIPLIMKSGSTGKVTETINGITKQIVALQVTTQPFSCADRHGTVKYRHPVMTYFTASPSAYSTWEPDAGGEDLLSDIQEICQRYMSCRVAGMRVEMEVRGGGVNLLGDTQWWGSSEIATLDIISAFIANDTNKRYGDHYVEEMTTSDKLMRLPGHKVHEYQCARSASQLLTPAPNKRFMLYSRKFPESPGDDTITKALASGIDTDQAVEAGGWDHRAFYSAGLDNAYDALIDPDHRAGKLHVIAKFPWGHLTTGEGWNTVNNDTLVGFLHTWHDIELKNDVHAFGPEPNP